MEAKDYTEKSDHLLTIKMDITQDKPDFLKKLSDLSFMTAKQQKQEITLLEKEIIANIKKWETGLYGASMASMSDKYDEFMTKIEEAKNALRMLKEL